MADSKIWTVEDTRRMLLGIPSEPTPPAEVGPITVETVVEEEMQTTETVEIVDAPPVGKGKAR